MDHSSSKDRAPRIADSQHYFEELAAAIRLIPHGVLREIERRVVVALMEGRTLFLAGNGGSAATASHMMCDLAKGTRSPSRRLRVIALTDNTPLITAWANDCSYEDIFSEQLKNLMGPRDVLLAISGSGNSGNILKALRTARELGAETLGFAGFSGGQMAALCDVCLIIPCDNMQLIEDVHHALGHALFTMVRNEINSQAMSAHA